MANRVFLSEVYWIMEDWDWEKNNAEGIFPDRISTGSDKKAHWKCHICGHEDYKRCNNWYYGHGCTKCARQRGAQQHTQTTLAKHGSFAKQYPELAREFHPALNGNHSPHEFNRGSNQKVWWRCAYGHDYQSTIANRVSGNGCPVCAGKKVVTGFNDLAFTHPQLASEWHPDKNLNLLPTQIIAGSHKKVWWLCPQGHSYQSTVEKRVSGNGCPICAGKQVLLGFNDLQSQLPDVAKDWHPTRNGSLTSEQVTVGCGKKVWWMCQVCGHEWLQFVYARQQCGCPKCSSEFKSSFPEQACYFYLSQATAAESRARVCKREIDVFLPALNVGIEYDGKFYHANRVVQDSAKQAYLAEHGIRIIRIVEAEDFHPRDDTICYPATKDYSNLGSAIISVCNLLGLAVPDIDIARDSAKIYGQYIFQRKQQSLAVVCPNVAAEWDYEKNAPITPEMISYGSKKVFWWKCKNGHEWKTAVCSRANRQGGSGCGFCSGHRKINRDELEL